MRKTLLCHFFNEQRLLPYWLDHHTKIFDQILLINYHSTDHSAEYFLRAQNNFLSGRSKCKVDMVVSRNADFGAINVDLEVQDYEDRIEGWKMTLNVTEFLYGDFTKLDDYQVQHIVPSFMLVDKDYVTPYRYEETKPTDFGIPYWVWDERAGRSLHNYRVNYPKPGRHYFVTPETYSKDFLIFHHGWYPMDDLTLNRKLQIQTRIPEYDVNNRLGWHHITTREKLIDKWKTEYLPKVGNHKEYLDKFRVDTLNSIC